MHYLKEDKLTSRQRNELPLGSKIRLTVLNRKHINLEVFPKWQPENIAKENKYKMNTGITVSVVFLHALGYYTRWVITR